MFGQTASAGVVDRGTTGRAVISASAKRIIGRPRGAYVVSRLALPPAAPRYNSPKTLVKCGPVATYNVRAKHNDSSKTNYDATAEVVTYRSNVASHTSSPRHFDVRVRPPAAASAGRLTKQNARGDLFNHVHL
ncbi:hypothetical protein EVAR_23153_1 [Eumeta japonica]|uniref:Uncharacterized protein n=1 Tax=Eumeta variegata TaxID=151549 RepID=A0A4C1VD81_EUMVA|nr:hypothetical protein EVAR_23153_1 [Eumeta japonica]